jgi:SAM-dependent methyltransferase
MWASGTAYERYVGRWSRVVAKEFLQSLGAKPNVRWLDVGCGTGALSQTILEYQPHAITAIDASEAFIRHAKEQIADSRVTFIVGDARELPFDNQTFDIVVSGLMLNFVPEVEKAAREMARVAKSGGTVAAYVWDYAGQMEMMRYFWDAVNALNPNVLIPDEGQRYPLCKPEPLTLLFQDIGLRDVEVGAIDIATIFKDFDDYWSPFLGGQGPASTYTISLDEMAREKLREYLHTHLPTRADGSIPLVARAWAVRGTKQKWNNLDRT